jgi:hypothetical protein
MDADEFLNHSNQEDKIAINLNQYRKECLHQGQELPDINQLKKLLKNGKRHKFIAAGKTVSSRWERIKTDEPGDDGKPVWKPKSYRCFVFKR